MVKTDYKRILVYMILFLSFDVCMGHKSQDELAENPNRPNIIYIMADDMGYGDANCYNSECGFPTPGLDRLASEGMRFTDAHSGSSVCTPTRYGLLTGRYAWRTRLQSGVLGLGDAPLISQEILTVQKLLKKKGYKTACIGKWHLGFQCVHPDGSPVKERNNLVPAGSMISDGPLVYDFDRFWGYHHAGSMRLWIEDEIVKEKIEVIEMLPLLCKKSVEYIRERGKKNDGPFFLYIPLNSPHSPIVPTEDWEGKSGINKYADFVMQTDEVVNQILKELDNAELSGNTIVIFTSDNGAPPIANIPELRRKGHDPLGGLRGTKADLWDGGHRVPLIVRWPGIVGPGTVSNAIICHNNLIATCAEILQTTLPDNAGVDSYSILPHLKGREDVISHPFIIHHSIYGYFSIRRDEWKLIACKGSGGWSYGDDGEEVQLYNMAIDPIERENLVNIKSDLVKQLTDLLQETVSNGRSRPGSKQKNDVPVVIRKAPPTRMRNVPDSLRVY